MTQKMLEELNGSGTADRTRKQPKVEVPPGSTSHRCQRSSNGSDTAAREFVLAVPKFGNNAVSDSVRFR